MQSEFHAPSAGKSILVIDDDPTVSQILSGSLEIPGCAIATLSGVEALASETEPLAIFVDIHLSETESGLAIIPTLKKQWPFTPIIVITSEEGEAFLEQAFVAGADDFIMKPIRPKEVQARFSTRLHELQSQAEQTSLTFQDLTLNIPYRMLSGPFGRKSLAPVETMMLATLMRAQGAVVMKETMKREAWGVLSVSDNAFYRKVFELRKNLAEVTNSLCIKASYGYGISLEIQD